jgi:hypothetical protein
VAVHDDVGTGPVERRPERPDGEVVAVLAGAEPRLMPDRERTAGVACVEVRGQPVTLGGFAVTAFDLAAIRVEDDDVPATEIERIPGLAVGIC